LPRWRIRNPDVYLAIWRFPLFPKEFIVPIQREWKPLGLVVKYRLRLPRSGGAAYAVNFDHRSGYREVGL
jgi:hypothetical protein